MLNEEWLGEAGSGQLANAIFLLIYVTQGVEEDWHLHGVLVH